MAEPISASYLGELLSQLCAALGKPFDARAKKMVAAYHKCLDDWSESAIEAAIWKACKTATKFPKPAELIALCARSGHGKLVVEAMERPDPLIHCPDCGEWWGYHRIVMMHGTPMLSTLQLVRHRDGCPYRKWLDRYVQFYGYSWVDGPPPAGTLEEGGEAWRVAGVLQLIHPLPPRIDLAKAARRPRPRTTGPMPITDVGPSATPATPAAEVG